MKYSKLRSIYENSPNWIKSLTRIVPFKYLAGKSYRQTMREIQWFDTASRNDILARQSDMLGDILKYAVEYVPAYQPYKSAVDKYKPFDALKEFPFLDKKTVSENIDKFLSIEKDRMKWYLTTTGGTTGNPLRIYLDNDSHYIETAFIHSQWKRVGFLPSMRKATFRGVKLDRIKVDEDVYWQTNPVYNEIQ